LSRVSTSGDFVKAEIEFEQEFKSLRRAESAKYNAGVDASLGFDRAEAVGQSGLGGLSASGPGSSVPLTTNGGTPDLGVTGRFSNKYKKGKNLLNDGKVTEEDFAFTKYMAGLSELQLGKYEEAKKSFKRSVGYNGRNYDARMRLGLLYVVERDFDKAANQLEALEKMRLKCKKKDCDDYDAILKSAATLAQGISGNLKTQ